MKGARLMCELFFKKERCCQSVTCIQPEHLERSDTNQLRQSGDVPLSGCFQELLLPPPRLSSLCSCTHQTLFENKGSWSTVMRSHQPLKKNKKNPHHFIPSSIVMISSSSVTSLGIWAVPLIMLEQASYRSSNRTISLRVQNEEKKKNMAITCHHSQKLQGGKREKSMTVIPNYSQLAEKRLHHKTQWTKQDLLFFNVLPFFQCRLLCAEVCPPCYSAHLHQHLPANMSHTANFTCSKYAPYCTQYTD